MGKQHMGCMNMTREKRTFNENSKLGFMRFIQLYNVLLILLVAIGLIFVRGSSLTFTPIVVCNILILLAQAAVIWLIAKRKMYTRQIVIGLEVFELAVTAVEQMLAGEFELGVFLGGGLGEYIVILYFLFSRRAKAVLVQPWSDQTLSDEQDAKDRELWDPKSIEFWMRLLIYFFVFSILGHWMEMGVQILVINGIMPGTIAAPDSLTWRDSLNPFFIYGIAVAFCGLALYPVFLKFREKFSKRWQAYLASFLVNTLFCVAAELILGFLFNADYSAWDYRDQFMNFEGQICLLYTLAFGIMSSFITWIVYPMMERNFSRVNRDVFRIIFVVACVLFLLIYATYNVDLDTLFPGEDLAFDFSEVDSSS